MSLAPNSLELQVITAGAFVAVLGISVWRWKRFRFPVAQRMLALLLIQLTALTAVAVAVNRSDNFYTTWSALAGSTDDIQSQVTEHRDIKGVMHKEATANGNGWRITREQQAVDMATAANSRIETVNIPGPASGFSGPAEIYLPGSYHRDPSRRYPVLQLPAGFPGSYQSRTTGMALKQNLDQLIAEGKMPAVVAVMPSQNPDPQFDSECLDTDPVVRHGHLADTYQSVDLRNFMTSKYQVGRERINWVLGGYSTGAYCAANLALRHSEQYAGVLAMSGFYTPGERGDGWKQYFSNKKQVSENDPMELAKNAHPPLAFFIVAAKDSQHDVTWAKEFSAVLPDTDPHSLMFTDTGGHSPAVWKVGSKMGFQWLARTLRG